jgi:DNA-binding transcriptional regulator YhcF (GntR family)
LHFAQYELPQLKEFCEKILVHFCTVENALDIVEYAKLYNLVEATKKIKRYISE